MKSIRQKQLTLIVENLDIPVNRNMDVYASVMQAWKTAMTTMDKLVGGMGHSVQDGSVLLGLSSWHLYPDIIILGKVTTETKQGDSLIAPGGIVTIGLQGVEANQDRGVYWSLPLAHLRYYGDPIQVEGSIAVDSSRVSIDQLLLVALGSLIATWSPHGSTLEESLKLICLMWQCVSKEITTYSNSMRIRFPKSCWLKLLSDGSNQYLSSTKLDQNTLRRLISLGQRRAHLFGSYRKPTNVLGITGAALVGMLNDDEKKISLLRRLAAKLKTEKDSVIIRISHVANYDFWETYATAIPEEIGGPHNQEKQYRHTRWTARGANPSLNPATSTGRNCYMEDFLEYEKKSIEALDGVGGIGWENPPKFFRNLPLAEPEISVPSGQAARSSSHWKLPGRSSRTIRNKKRKSYARFEFLYGDINSAALFRRSDRPEVALDEVSVSITEITDGFTSNSISPANFLRHLTMEWIPFAQDSNTGGEVLQKSLRALATVVKVYKSLPNATVPLSVVSFGPLSNAKWVPARSTKYDDAPFLSVLLSYNLSRRATFSCIAMFESGGFNFLPEHLDRVMAISVGDSIYVAAPLLDDPSARPEPQEVRHIVGNIGRAGLALLIPPTVPKKKQPDLESYQLVNHYPYDGKFEDSFQSTSLHLAFSGYELPMDVGEHGGRDREAFFLESLVSVHDRGEWIADLDILSTFDSPRFRRIIDRPCCRASRPGQVPNFPLVSIDSWQELLDVPLDAGVVRAQDNWLGRLAAASLSIRLGYHIILFVGSACWKCGEKIVEDIHQYVAGEPGDDDQAAPTIVFII